MAEILSVCGIFGIFLALISYVSAARDIVVGEGVPRRMFDAEIDVVLTSHNDYRRQQGSSNMEYMYYHVKLEEQALLVAKECRFEHAFPDVSGLEWKSTGQNLFYVTGSFDSDKGSFNLAHGIKVWYDEIKDYHYDSGKCNEGKPCGHYTQVVWAKTKYVGCAYNFCKRLGKVSNAHYLVCNYGPPGNIGRQKPYKKGTGCTECTSGSSECDNGLCKLCSVDGGNCVCEARCYNCGTAPTNGSDCRCNCASGWGGQTCQTDNGGASGSCGVATSNINVIGPALSYDFSGAASPVTSLIKSLLLAVAVVTIFK